jgi:UDP-galactopyranose mutase
LYFDIQKHNCEYYQQAEAVNYPNNFDFTRIVEHKYFLNQKSNKTIISVEYPQNYETGKNERFYPVSNPENDALYNKYALEIKKAENIYFMGRLGTYKYLNMDTAVEKVMEFFDNCLNNRKV